MFARRLPAALATSVLAFVAFAPSSAAQPVGDLPPNLGGFTTSMGRPPAVRWFAGFAIGADRAAGAAQTIGHANAGFYRDLLNPAIAALGVEGLVYGGRRGDFERFREGWDGGLMLGLASPVSRLSVGVDANLVDRSADLYLTLAHPLRRSGFPVPGGLLRATWIPGRNHSTAVGLSFPLGQRFAGRTRPLVDRVRLPAPPQRLRVSYTPSAHLTRFVAEASTLAHAVRRSVVPFIDAWDRNPERSLGKFAAEMTALSAELADSAPGPVERVDAFHRTMATAFSIVVAPNGASVDAPTDAGWRAWDAAREILLDRVLLPYNRLLGRPRTDESVRGFGAAASMAFYERLATANVVPAERLVASAWLFETLLDVVESVRTAAHNDWGDARYVFLPLQLAIRPAEVTGQAALDALLERALDTRFAPGNDVFYVENEQFQAEFSRMIHEAREYSVLWIHDYRGVDADGNPDAVAHFHTVDTYLRALTAAVRRYDETGKIPQHLVLLDQWFYQANRGWLFLDLLRDPLRHELRLPSAFATMEASVRAAQEELRRAVADSRLLQAQARHAPRGWIENVVRVHVNITNPADATFWSRELLPFIGLTDIIARDHRKVAFFDLSEDDPYLGRAMYTGMGIGSHYAGAGWEDRALLVRGPAVLGLKAEARRVLERQGFGSAEIPWALRARPLAVDYAARVDSFRREHLESARALGAHNEVGFGEKSVNLLKAILYTLLPPGAVIKIPDSLWNHPLWGSMLLGHALRGGRVLLIAPSLAHAPSDGFPQMSRAQELLSRLVLSQELLEAPLARRGGFLRVGLYEPDIDVGNTPARMRQVVRTLDENPWLSGLFGFHPSVPARLQETAARLEAQGFTRTYLAGPASATPRLHLKSHFVATREAWDGLLGDATAGDLLVAYFESIAAQNRALAERRTVPLDALTRAVIPPGRALAEGRLNALRRDGSTANAALYYLSGSHNQNYRSSTTDGELVLAVAGWPALHGLPDFVVLAGLSTWIDSVEALEARFPPYTGLRRRISRFLRQLV